MTKEERAAYWKTYYAKHRDELIARQKARYRANSEQLKAQIVAWQRAHPERVRENMHRTRAKRKSAPTCAHLGCAVLGPVNFAWQTNPHRCYLCGRSVSMEWMDHVVPLSKGGAHCAENLRPACRTCNLKKGTKLLVA